ncbi:uncharacterized protein LOC143426847 [Xylocopa sonorina]|uniref:uncharacterized protein LOC143426847 n=1 Tax=Xylocopa sonorina TaxID=1818115 RepID=UPI00403AC321
MEIKRRFMLWDQCPHVYPVSTYIKVTSSMSRIRVQLSAAIRANMIEIIVLFIGVVGTLAVPGTPETPYGSTNITKDTEKIILPLPGSENLDEKAMPLSKLVNNQSSNLSGDQNLAEKTQIQPELPGTKNLAEKRLPETLLRMLSQLSERTYP